MLCVEAFRVGEPQYSRGPQADPTAGAHRILLVVHDWTHAAAELADLLEDRPALVLSGAGLSTDSGIPDYRGPDGTRRVTPMSHGEFVTSPAGRQRYWARSYAGWERFSAARPNDGHRAITTLQQAGRVGAIISQNVDGLHQAAGARDVIDLHGRLAEVVCLTCDARLERSAVQEWMATANPDFARTVALAPGGGSRVSAQIRPDGDVVLDDAAVAGFRAPRCPVCRGDALKPDVVFFGGSVPKERVERCFALTDQARALLVVGSSLMVMSGLRFVKRAAAHGMPIAVLTKGPTRGDDLATLKIDAPITPVLSRLAGAVRPGAAPR